jgi:putative hemolysin
VATTALQAHGGQHRPNKFLWAVVFSVAIGMALIVALPQSHAVEKHGADAVAIRKCLQDKGPLKVFKSTVEQGVFYQICQLPDGRVGLQVVKWAKDLGQWIEKTAFVRGDGSLKAVIEYLSKFSTPYNGPLPP